MSQQQPQSPSTSSAGGLSSTYSSPFRRRFDLKTRRETLERLARSHRLRHPGNPEESSPDRTTTRNTSSSQDDNTSKAKIESLVKNQEEKAPGEGTTVVTASTRTTSSTLATIPGYSALQDDSSGEQAATAKQVIDDSENRQYSTPNVRRKPLHLETHNEEGTDVHRYYRITYQGVVPLLAHPNLHAPKSGAYLGYGEIVSSRHEVDVIDEEDSTFTEISPRNSDVASPESPPRSVLSHTAGSVSSLDTLRTASTAAPSQMTRLQIVSLPRKMVRIDEVLTGGYAVDASEHATPKTPNLHHVPMVGPSPLPLSESDESTTSQSYGYLCTRKRHTVIAERIPTPPLLQRGTFLFKIVSSAPLAILTGPCVDAPTTRAMLLPGTVHEVCLKLFLQDVCFLRLSHRRGWITDRRITSLNGGIAKIAAVPAVKEISDAADDLSLASASIVSTSSTVRRRHRPPRKRRERHATPQKTPSPLRPGTLTPSSNVSMLSDDEVSYDLGSQYKFPSPEREPAFFLMRVNAPRGLKILDAPHFQVSSLIHGKSDSGAPSSSQVAASSGSKSIFQTMAGHHTTKGTRTSQIRNPAIFDSITKTRLLPRGVIFEASKRMEGSGAFNKGAGLIKLSDNSGWAIVPRQDELDVQYKNYHGSTALNVKEGEATRAYEEIGNAVDDVESIWVRVLTKNGVQVSCPPPLSLVAKDDDTTTSPTSSSTGGGGGGSSISGSNVGLGADSSDVASSVGSAFLDAMFRTPKKREPSRTLENRTAQESGHARKGTTGNELEQVPNIVPCGSCVQVDRWDDFGASGKHSAQIHQDYVRLRGGQGWIPLNKLGKTVSAVIPKPDIRMGSFWFRVTSRRGIKVRLGPSRKAGSIKSDDGIYFRFECGEFLRASEVLTIFHEHGPSESYAKLYRNRHVRLNDADCEYRQLLSLTTPAEWVQIHSDDNLYLEECGAEPHMLRHRDGWRYNVVAESGVSVRLGPSFAAEVTGVTLLAGESVLITERVTAPGEDMTWLRLKDGEGWIHDSDMHGQPVVIAHSLRDRIHGAPHKPGRPEHDDIRYNSIVARLFHGGPGMDGGMDLSKTYTA